MTQSLSTDVANVSGINLFPPLYSMYCFSSWVKYVSLPVHLPPHPVLQGASAQHDNCVAHFVVSVDTSFDKILGGT